MLLRIKKSKIMSYFELPALELPPQNNPCQAVAGFMGQIVTKHNCMTTYDLVALAMDRGCETVDDFSAFLAPVPGAIPLEQFEAEIIHISIRAEEAQSQPLLRIAS